MNYKVWAEEYVTESKVIKNSIDKEKDKLKKAKRFEEQQSINRRIQILRSMYQESVLTASLLMERG